MHCTLSKDVKGHIDKITKIDANHTRIKGWTFYAKNMEVLPLRLAIDNGKFIDIETHERGDVGHHFRNSNIHDCGWEIEIDHNKVHMIQINIYNEWMPVFGISKNPRKDEPDEKPERKKESKGISMEGGSGGATEDFVPKINKKIPSFVVVDDFYENPDEVREFALSCDFKEHPQNHKGKRTDECYRFPGLKERFEEIIGTKIKNWEFFGTNGCFQVCLSGDISVFHHDAQKFAGVLFLTKNSPPQSGTSFYRSKHTHKMKVSDEEHEEVFKNGFLDPTEFELVDCVGNLYNRLVLFDAKLIHAGNNYFGNSKENGRLFQLFFFDLEDEE